MNRLKKENVEPSTLFFNYYNKLIRKKLINLLSD